jgi:hypothetical protein
MGKFVRFGNASIDIDCIQRFEVEPRDNERFRLVIVMKQGSDYVEFGLSYQNAFAKLREYTLLVREARTISA